MERDYFLDRTDDRMYREKIYIGRYVFICTKANQKTAKKIEDLNLVTVKVNLTKSLKHPCGQKIIGIDQKTGEELIGRVTYVLNDDGSVKTKNGPTDLKLNLVENSFRLYLIINIYNNINIQILLNRFKFYFSKDEIKKEIKNIKIGKCTYINGIAQVYINNELFLYHDFEILNGKEINNNITKLSLFDLLTEYKKPINTSLSFNKEYQINPLGFFIKKYKKTTN